MKIAFAKENNKVATHYGHCNDFRIIEVDNQKIIKSEDIFDDVYTHQKRAAYLKNLGVEVLVISGLGDRAKQTLIQENIQVIDGKNLNLEEAIDRYIKGLLTDEIETHAHHHDHC